jgi:hypothetical protein
MHVCAPNIACRKEGWNRYYKTNCTIKDGFFCLGIYFKIKLSSQEEFKYLFLKKGAELSIKRSNATGQVATNGAQPWL